MAILNPELIKKNNVSVENQLKLLDMYEELDQLFQRAKDNPSDEECKTIGLEIQDLEFTLQRLWNFSEDPNFHTYWNKLPGCICPKLDNADSFGHRRITNKSCKYHGDVTKSL